METKTLILNFVCNEPIKEKADKLRGFFANRFGEYILVHQHLKLPNESLLNFNQKIEVNQSGQNVDEQAQIYLYKNCDNKAGNFYKTENDVQNFNLVSKLCNNRFLYKIPLIQYKIFHNKPFVVGINEGAEILKKIYNDINYLKIGSHEYQIKQKIIIERNDNFGLVDKENMYSFLSPWLALNGKNYEKYIMTDILEKKIKLFEKILTGNIISISKNLKYTVPGAIKVKICNIREVQTSLKGIPMFGFMGMFLINFEIPDYWGIGKAISRGFGTIKKI